MAIGTDNAQVALSIQRQLEEALQTNKARDLSADMVVAAARRVRENQDRAARVVSSCSQVGVTIQYIVY